MDKLPCPPARTETQAGISRRPRTLGEHLRRVRLDRGLWQKQVAKEIGCSKASLTNWEKGHAEPRPALGRLAWRWGAKVNLLIP
jgi:DNA-binding transcriptional regulator YiaG